MPTDKNKAKASVRSPFTGGWASNGRNMNNELVREAHAVKNNPNRAPEFVTGRQKAKQTSFKSRSRTSSEIAAGVKNTPSKMPIAGLSKSGNTMLMGSKEVETPSTFNTSAANNMAKAPNFAKMAESGSTAKEIKSSFKDYKKVVKGQIKDHKAAIKVQNKTARKTARAENKTARAEKQTSKKVDRLTKRYNKAKR
jgi:hypothetical protein